MKTELVAGICIFLINVIFALSFFFGVIYLEQTKRCSLGVIVLNACDKYGWDVIDN